MTFAKTVATWLVIATLLLVNGALGQMVFIPVLGLEAGEMMGAFIAITVIFGVSRWFLTVERDVPLAQVLGVATLWGVLGLFLEVALGRSLPLGGPGLPQYRMWDGSFWPLIVLALGTAPILWLRRSGAAAGVVK
jgi:hypothetical protein